MLYAVWEFHCRSSFLLHAICLELLSTTPKVVSLARKAIWKDLTMQNAQKRGISLENRCYQYLLEMKTIDFLFRYEKIKCFFLFDKA